MEDDASESAVDPAPRVRRRGIQLLRISLLGQLMCAVGLIVTTLLWGRLPVQEVLAATWLVICILSIAQLVEAARRERRGALAGRARRRMDAASSIPVRPLSLLRRARLSADRVRVG
ncbi:hypothetical protein LG314_04910 [Agrococcus terreus]|uniref:hypothetical protein n=1 Tax=Agrococcus terreus TaxID=574649 RepID=UPI00384ED68A